VESLGIGESEFCAAFMEYAKNISLIKEKYTEKIRNR